MELSVGNDGTDGAGRGGASSLLLMLYTRQSRYLKTTDKKITSLQSFSMSAQKLTPPAHLAAAMTRNARQHDEDEMRTVSFNHPSTQVKSRGHLLEVPIYQLSSAIERMKKIRTGTLCPT